MSYRPGNRSPFLPPKTGDRKTFCFARRLLKNLAYGATSIFFRAQTGTFRWLFATPKSILKGFFLPKRGSKPWTQVVLYASKLRWKKNLAWKLWKWGLNVTAQNSAHDKMAAHPSVFIASTPQLWGVFFSFSFPQKSSPSWMSETEWCSSCVPSSLLHTCLKTPLSATYSIFLPQAGNLPLNHALYFFYPHSTPWLNPLLCDHRSFVTRVLAPPLLPA